MVTRKSNLPEPPRARTARSSRQHGLHLSGCCSMTDLRFVAGPSEILRAESRGKVDQRAGDGRHRDSAPARRVLAINPSAARGPDTGNAALAGRDHLGRWPRSLDQAEEMGGGPPAQQCSLAAGLDCGQVARLDARRLVADPVDAPVDADQRALPLALLDLLRGYPGDEELGPGDDPMRAPRDSGDHPLSRAAFWSHSNHKSASLQICPPPCRFSGP